MTHNKISTLLIALFVGLILQSCAGSGALSGDSRVYDKDFDSMVGIVEKAIVSSNLNLDYSSTHKDGSVSIKISKNAYAHSGGKRIQQSGGYVRVIKVSENKTRVEVENPDYHHSIPQYQRDDYQYIVFRNIDSLVGTKKKATK